MLCFEKATGFCALHKPQIMGIEHNKMKTHLKPCMDIQ